MRFAPDIEALLGFDEKVVSAPMNPVAIVGGAYEGADRFSKSMALWAPPIQSADREILPVKLIVDARVKDLLRNDAYVAAGASLHRNGIVGAVFLLNAKPETKVLGLDETWEAEFQEEVETKFTLWAESLNHWADASRMNTFTGLVRLAVGVYVMAGEMLASVEWIRELGRAFNTAIQMIDVDRLSTPPTEIESKFLRGGVARDKYGAPQGYWVRNAHPSDYYATGLMDNYTWKFVPARKPWGRPQMIHILEQMRPDQTRGISQMVSALKETRMTQKFRDIVLQNAVVNATFAASIESELPSETVFSQIGGTDTPAGPDGQPSNIVTAFCADYLAAIQEYAGSAKNLTMDGVKIPHLFPGTKLQLRPAGQGGPLGTEFEASLLRYIAANLEVSYEELARDYSKTNYASAKTAGAQTERAMAAKKKMVADRFAGIIYRLWLEEAINKGQITSLPRNAPSFYDGQNADAYASCDWIGASKGQIDELKETQAAVLRINNGLSTYEVEMARLGRDYRKVFSQQAREKGMREKLGIYVAPQPADPSKTMNAATGQPEDKQGASQ